MDPIAIGSVAMSFTAGLLGGAFIILGAIEIVNRRPIINIQRLNWTPAEGTAIGLIHIIQGFVLGGYGLVGAMLATSGFTIPGTGKPWGFLFSASLWLILMLTLVSLMVLESRHRRARTSTGPAVR